MSAQTRLSTRARFKVGRVGNVHTLTVLERVAVDRVKLFGTATLGEIITRTSLVRCGERRTRTIVAGLVENGVLVSPK